MCLAWRREEVLQPMDLGKHTFLRKRLLSTWAAMELWELVHYFSIWIGLLCLILIVNGLTDPGRQVEA